MALPVLTTEAVMEALSIDWQPITALIFKMKIKEMMDARFLQIKLKDLIRKNIVLVETKTGKKHYKLKEPNDAVINDNEDFFDFDIENESGWTEIKDYPRSQENIDFINSEVAYLLEKIGNMDTLDENTMMDVEMNILGLSHLGDTYHKHGDNQLAIDFYESALKLHTASGEDKKFIKFLLKDIGNVLFEEDNYQEAIKYYENALELSILEEVSPFNREVLFNLGTSYSNINQAEKAILSFEKLAEHDPELDIIWSALGLAYSANKEYEKAVESFEIALQFNPSDEEIITKLNFAVDEMKKNEQLVLEESPQELQDEIKDSVFSKDDILSLLKKLTNQFEKLIKITEFSTTIQIKSFINDLIKPFFEKPSNRKIKKLKKDIEQHIEGWPEDKREEFFNEYFRTIKRYEDLQPSKWKKYGSGLLKLIPILR